MKLPKNSTKLTNGRATPMELQESVLPSDIRINLAQAVNSRLTSTIRANIDLPIRQLAPSIVRFDRTSRPPNVGVAQIDERLN